MQYQCLPSINLEELLLSQVKEQGQLILGKWGHILLLKIDSFIGLMTSSVFSVPA